VADSNISRDYTECDPRPFEKSGVGLIPGVEMGRKWCGPNDSIAR